MFKVNKAEAEMLLHVMKAKLRVFESEKYVVKQLEDFVATNPEPMEQCEISITIAELRKLSHLGGSFGERVNKELNIRKERVKAALGTP